MRKSIDIFKVKLVKEATENKYETQINNPWDAADVVQDYIGDADREHFLVLALGTKNDLAGINRVSTGALNNTVIHPREVFKPAIVSNASAIIVAHNHPSGNVSPSSEDHEITQRLKEAGELLGIKLLDHLIIGFDTDKVYSFKKHDEL